MSVSRNSDVTKMKFYNVFKDVLFFNPPYQRDFGWDNQLSIKWFDNFKEKDCFINQPITIKEINLNKNVEQFLKFEIIDGQQRVTSSILLCLAIFKVYKDKILNKEIDLNIYSNIQDLNDFRYFITSNKERNKRFNNILNEINEFFKIEKFIFEDTFLQNKSQNKNTKDLYNIIHNEKKATKEEKKKNLFINNYCLYISLLEKLSLNEFITYKSNFLDSMFLFVYEEKDSSQSFHDINRNKLLMQLKDYVKAMFLTCDINGEFDESLEDSWEEIISIVNNNQIFKSSFGNALSWFLLYNSPNEFNMNKENRNWDNDIFYCDLLKTIIKKNNEKTILTKFNNFIKEIDLISNGKEKFNNNVLSLNIISTTTHHFISYLFLNEIDKKTKDNIIKDVLIPYFMRICYCSEFSISKKFFATSIIEFYQYMSKITKDENESIDKYYENVYNAYYMFFGKDYSLKIYNNDEMSLRNYSIETSQKQNNILKVFKVLIGSSNDDYSIEHIIPQSYVENKENFEKHKNKIYQHNDDFILMKDIVYSLGNLTIITKKINSSLSNKKTSDKSDKLQNFSNNLFLDVIDNVNIENNTFGINEINIRSKRLKNLIEKSSSIQFDFDKLNKLLNIKQ